MIVAAPVCGLVTQTCHRLGLYEGEFAYKFTVSCSQLNIKRERERGKAGKKTELNLDEF